MQWDRLKAEQETAELQQCTFTPSVNDSKDAHTPLHRRLEELQRQRRCLACMLPILTLTYATALAHIS